MNWLKNKIYHWLMSEDVTPERGICAPTRRSNGSAFSFTEAENGYLIETYDYKTDRALMYVCKDTEDLATFISTTLVTRRLLK